MEVDTPERGAALWRAFNRLDIVEIAFPENHPSVHTDPDDIGITTPDFSGQQGYP